MIIRCFGARGSVPVFGKEFLKYGGSTTCVEIRTKNDEIIIIDAGTGIRRLGERLINENRHSFSLIFTHAHWDHILGFPFFKPIYFDNTSIKIFGCPFSQQSIKKMISQIMTAPYFPIDFEDVKAGISYIGSCKNEFSIDSVTVTPIYLSHPNQGIGYKFTEDNKSFVFLTDNELCFKHPGGLGYHDYLQFSSGSDFLIHDAEFTEDEYKTTRTWGHSTYNDALRLALAAKVKRLGLYHHNQERSDTAIDEIIQDCSNIIGDNGSNLECFAVHEGMEIEL